MWTKKKVVISKYVRIFTNSGVNTKKALHLKKCAIFHKFWSETSNERVFITKSAKKQFLLTNSSRVITSISGVSGLELPISGTEPVTFFWAQCSLGGHNSCLRGTSSYLGAHGPEMLPVASGLLQNYSNLSNCHYRIFVTEIMPEIGFIEKRELFEITKRYPKPFSTISFICENTI